MELFRKYRAWARDKGRRVGLSQLCRKMISSTLQRRRWLSMVVKNISLRGEEGGGAKHHRCYFGEHIPQLPLNTPTFALKQRRLRRNTVDAYKITRLVGEAQTDLLMNERLLAGGVFDIWNRHV